MMTAIYLLIALIVVALIARFVNTNADIPGEIKRVVNLVVALIIVGIALWLINTFIPMAQSIKTILNIVVVVATCVFVLQALGVWNQMIRMCKSMSAHLTAPRPPEPSDKAPENAKPSEQH
jgi:undecaprenyl pyrophosphate phosphatase UppP